MRAVAGLVLILISVWVLEQARIGVEFTTRMVGDTPVTVLARADADGPPVVIAHGFAGSSQMMQGYALPLARSGYPVYAFDFLGHGRHEVPMSGDVTSPEGTTRLLVEQTEAVIDAVAGPGARVALLGHSMATDVLVRVANGRSDIGPVVLVSAFSREIDAAHPRDLLLVVGAWEPGLRDFALEAVRMVAPGVPEGETAVDGDTRRRAVVAPFTEHVSILQSRVGRDAALVWLDESFGRRSDTKALPTGPAIVGLLVGVVLLFLALARALPERRVPRVHLSRWRWAAAILLSAIATPPMAVMADPGIMPVLVADYLALHLAIYGGLQLGLLALWRVPLGPFSTVGYLALLIGSVVFGLALDRYAANFWPTGDRFWIIGVMALGGVLFFVADARLAHGATKVQRLILHGAFLASLLGAVALDFQDLFFLLMIAPVIVLFYLVFGTMGHAVSRRVGPLAPGLALGLVLAWSLGVSFPLFQG